MGRRDLPHVSKLFLMKEKKRNKLIKKLLKSKNKGKLYKKLYKKQLK